MPDEGQTPDDQLEAPGQPIPRAVCRAEGPVEGVVGVPGSKSLSNRALLAASMAPGQSSILGISRSDDTNSLIGVLRAFGAEISEIPGTEAGVAFGDTGGGQVTVTGGAFRLQPAGEHRGAHCGEAGTTFRFAAALAGVLDGESVLTCGPQLAARPLTPLLEALRELGATVRWAPEDGPEGGGRLEVCGRGFAKVPTAVTVDAHINTLLGSPALASARSARMAST